MRRDVFQAIADPTRRAIIFLLAANAMNPNELARHFQVSRQAVSKHLQILVDCDLVKQEPKGRIILYHLKPEKIKEVNRWIADFEELLNKRLEQNDTVLEPVNPNQHEG